MMNERIEKIGKGKICAECGDPAVVGYETIMPDGQDKIFYACEDCRGIVCNYFFDVCPFCENEVLIRESDLEKGDEEVNKILTSECSVECRKLHEAITGHYSLLKISRDGVTGHIPMPIILQEEKEFYEFIGELLRSRAIKTDERSQWYYKCWADDCDNESYFSGYCNNCENYYEEHGYPKEETKRIEEREEKKDRMKEKFMEKLEKGNWTNLMEEYNAVFIFP